jgi:hypothetical protein
MCSIATSIAAPMPCLLRDADYNPVGATGKPECSIKRRDSACFVHLPAA